MFDFKGRTGTYTGETTNGSVSSWRFTIVDVSQLYHNKVEWSFMMELENGAIIHRRALDGGIRMDQVRPKPKRKEPLPGGKPHSKTKVGEFEESEETKLRVVGDDD